MKIGFVNSYGAKLAFRQNMALDDSYKISNENYGAIKGVKTEDYDFLEKFSYLYLCKQLLVIPSRAQCG